MICLDQTTTGDGLICALQILAVMRQTGGRLSELAAGMPKYPQTLLNVKTEKRMNPDDSPMIREAVADAESELKDTGRVVLRASGTEPVIRVMVEGEDAQQVVNLANKLARTVEEAAR